MLLDEVYAREAPREEAVRFTFAFARMEYALKNAGFFLVDERHAVSADWDRFALKTNDLEETATGELAKAVAYLYENPPMVERERRGQIDFEAPARQGRSNAELCRMVRRVRNNLFHGGKVPYHDRDERLVRCSLEVLRALLEQNEMVAAEFR